MGFLLLHAFSLTLLFFDLVDARQWSFLVSPLSGILFWWDLDKPFSFSGTRMMAGILLGLSIWILYYFS
jgi:hypothetical protein